VRFAKPNQYIGGQGEANIKQRIVSEVPAQSVALTTSVVGTSDTIF
jgi:hypothetical protein